MEISKIPPYIVIETSKEVIFYISKKSSSIVDIKLWMKKLNLTDYRGMIINSQCIFNRFKNLDCESNSY